MRLDDRRRALMPTSGTAPILPPEYQQVEYVKNPLSGGAYFNTSVVYPDHFKIEVTAQKDSEPTNYDGIVCGYRGAGNKNYIAYRKQGGFVFAGAITTLNSDIGNQTEITAIYDGDRQITAKNSYGVDTITEQGSANIDTSGELRVFWLGLAATQFSDGRICDLTMSNNDTNTDVLHLIPCRRIADDVGGMYDIVNNAFYASTGTSAFVVGPDIN